MPGGASTYENPTYENSAQQAMYQICSSTGRAGTGTVTIFSNSAYGAAGLSFERCSTNIIMRCRLIFGLVVTMA